MIPEPKTNPRTLRVLRMKGACAKTSLCSSTLHDLINRGVFPKPFQLAPGGKAIGWLESDIDAYILSRRDAAKEES